MCVICSPTYMYHMYVCVYTYAHHMFSNTHVSYACIVYVCICHMHVYFRKGHQEGITVGAETCYPGWWLFTEDTGSSEGAATALTWRIDRQTHSLMA